MSNRKARRAPGFFFAVIAATGLPFARAAFADERDALFDRSLASSCSACHGTAGRPPPAAAVPPIAGMPADRFRAAMRGFRQGSRSGTVMPQIAKGYNDDQIDRLARHFEAQP